MQNNVKLDFARFSQRVAGVFFNPSSSSGRWMKKRKPRAVRDKEWKSLWDFFDGRERCKKVIGTDCSFFLCGASPFGSVATPGWIGAMASWTGRWLLLVLNRRFLSFYFYCQCLSFGCSPVTLDETGVAEGQSNKNGRPLRFQLSSCANGSTASLAARGPQLDEEIDQRSLLE